MQNLHDFFRTHASASWKVEQVPTPKDDYHNFLTQIDKAIDALQDITLPASRPNPEQKPSRMEQANLDPFVTPPPAGGDHESRTSAIDVLCSHSAIQ